jgi:hypothetical protein
MAIQKITSGIIQDGAVAAADIVSVANTAITGNIISSQIAPDQTLNGNVSVTGNTILGDATTDTLNVGDGGLVKDASGNVGIGTNSPSCKLELATTNQSFKITGSGASNWLTIANTTRSYNIGIDNAVNGFNIYDNTSSAYRMVIDSSGNLLVGVTADPSGSGNNGASFFKAANNYELHSRSGVNTTSYIGIFYNGNGTVGSISTNGSATSYSTSSDYRLKNTITPMTGALAKVALLKPCTYKWNADNSDGEGFIAHELQEVVEGCVTGEKDAVDAEGKPVHQGIDTSFLVATLTAAIQEQQALITQLQADVATLKALSALEIK